ncbi:jg9582 [Pararge aegeria aegeria]|uniref:Jg9582 protein n=1 Tax=Pararge aegeria aegeria TaxID=348720 RepID=A0A8S4S5E4_9NEOP|nr:jg9582 [Pararge aegeria aegeria]
MFSLLRCHSSTLGPQRRNVEVPKCWNGDPAPVNAALVGPKQIGLITSNESLGAAGPGLWIFELSTKDLCPAVSGVHRVFDQGMHKEG